MTQTAAQQWFFSQFELTAYPVTSVPDTVEFPYITYTPYIGVWEGTATITCELWYYTSSEAIPNAKVKEISDYIGLGGKIVPCDGGALWFKHGSPFAQSLRDEVSVDIKRRYININIDFLTIN